jgi:transcriptional regulator with XRE-family HTH domain
VNTVNRNGLPAGLPLIPPADNAAQRFLEAKLLLAWTEATTELRRGSGGRAVPSFVGATQPMERSLTINVSNPASLSSVLHRAWPAIWDGEVLGAPGLQPCYGRNSLELRLVGSDNSVRARVRLLGLSRQEFRMVSTHDQTDTPPTRDPVPPTDALLSGILRRIPLWRAADQIQIGVSGDLINIEWLGGPDGNAVATVLGQSSCAIPNAAVDVSTVGDAHHIILAHTDQPPVPPTEPWTAWRALHDAPSTSRLGTTPAPNLTDPLLPLQRWESAEMREALAGREVSTVYRLLRRTGVSQRQIAAMTGQSQSEVSEILKGRQVMAYDVLARIADGLGVPRGYLGLAYDEATAIRVASAKETSDAEEDVKRRKLLAHAAAVAVGAHVLGDADSGSWVSNPVLTPVPGRIGMTDVRQVEAATRALRSLDHQYGGGFCRDAVVAQLSRGQQMLQSSASDHVRKRLHAALADLHNLAGWTSFETGYFDSARNHFGRALELARAADSAELVANILYRMGRVYLHRGAHDHAEKMFQLSRIAAQEAGLTDDVMQRSRSRT